MCTFSSYPRGAMLRRQCDPVKVVRGLFNSKSRRNLSAASVLYIERTVGRRDGFITWLKDIFNKSGGEPHADVIFEREDKSHKADTVIVDRAAVATPFNQPEIAATTRLADSSDKVDVINQKLANFYTVQSMTKFEYENIRAEKRNVENGEHAYAVRQSAICATSQSSRFAAGKTSEREIDLDSSWRDLVRMYRSEGNGDAIEFAARNDPDVASHYRCYTSPRHCYRLPPQRTEQPLLGLCVPNRYINMPTRAIVGFAPRNSKPPIREPNASEKREKKDGKKDKKEKKKPIIRTNNESVDSSENRAGMVANDNPRSDPDAGFRYKWGVKLAEEQLAAEAANDNDKLAEKGQRYVTKRLWGVNLKQPKPDIAPLATASSGRGAEKASQNASSIFENGDTTADKATSNVETASSDSTEKPDASSLKGTTAEYLATPSYQTGSGDDLIATQQDSGDANLYLSSAELRKMIRTSPDMLTETTVVDNEFNIPEEAGLDAEIAAWQNLTMRSVPKIKEHYLPTDNVEDLGMVSIRPEAPQPKLDVRVVKSTEDKEIEQSGSQDISPKSIKIKRVGLAQKSDSYSIGRKLHTLNTQILYRHNSIQRHIKLLSSNFASINRTKKCPGFAFSTNPDDSIPEKVIDKTSNQQNKQQIDSKDQNEKNSNDLNLNNTSNNNRSPLLVESQALSSNDRKQADADFAKTLDVIADKEMEISMQMNQLQSADRKKIAHLSDSIVSPELTQKDKPSYKDEDAQEETKHYEESYDDLHDEGATYVDLNDPSDSGSIKSDTIKSTKKDSRPRDDNIATFDSNVTNAEDDLSKEYITDGDCVRLPGDPYPYSKENLDKWRVPDGRNLVYKAWKRGTSGSSESPTGARSTLRNANDAYANAAGEPRDSHAGNAIMETSGSGDGSARKTMGQVNGFHVSSQDQRAVSDCLRGDAADAQGLQRWTEAFSRFNVGEKTNEAARSGDNMPFPARYE